MKISFKNDYAEGAHPAILEALMRTNHLQQPSYGWDDYSVAAKELLREKIACPEAQIHFVSGGDRSYRGRGAQNTPCPSCKRQNNP